MIEPVWPSDLNPTASNRLLVWNRWLKERFPTRLVGELELSEAEFRRLLGDVRDYTDGIEGHFSSPPRSFYPRILLTIMTFTARYDYAGAFWPAFEKNLGLDSVEQGDWGSAFRKGLADFGLIRPPEHWMVNVFPVLFHSIVPERSLEDFALMARALCEAVDVRLLDDDALGQALSSADLPVLLKRFVSGSESRAVAHELLRHVAEDFRLGANLDQDTLRDRILEAMRSASMSGARMLGLHVHPVTWRWDFNNGRCGVWLSVNRAFEENPLALSVSGDTWSVRSRRTPDGWQLMPQLLALPLSSGGKRGSITSHEGELLQLRISSAPLAPPYVFRSSGNTGVYESSKIAVSGDFAIAKKKSTRVVAADGSNVLCEEELPIPLLAGAEEAGIYALSEGDRILVENECVFAVRRAIRPSVELRGRTAWMAFASRGEVSVCSDPPRLEVQSPESDSAFILFEGASARPISTVPFDERLQIRPVVRAGFEYRASVTVAGRAAGANSVEFMVLPIRSEIAEVGGQLFLLISGEGSLTIGSRESKLKSSEPVEISFGELHSSDKIVYDFAGRSYVLRYSGARPTLWGFELGSLNNAKVVVRADRLATSSKLFVTGMPGSSIDLAVDGERFATSKVGGDGSAVMSLSSLIAASRARETVDVTISAGGSTWHALTILSAPQVAYDGISASRFAVQGPLALDTPVDELNLEANAFHAPWIPAIVIPFEKSGPTWFIDAQLPPQHWELSLAGQIDGVPVRIMRNGEPWARQFGAAADSRTRLDEDIYNILIGKCEIIIDHFAESDVVESVRRALIMLSVDLRRKERSVIEKLLEECARRLLVRDIAEVEKMLSKGSNAKALIRVAGMSQLPVAAFAVLPFRVPLTVDQPTAIEVFRTFARMDASRGGKENDPALASFISGLEADPHPLIAGYAQLLRQLYATETGIPARLEELFSSRVVSEAILEIDRFGTILKWTGNAAPERSLFSLIVTRLWALATIARNTNLLEKSTCIPSSVRLCSSLIYDLSLGELTQLALAWV